MIRSLYLLALGLLIALLGCSNSEYAPGAGENDYLGSLELKDFVVIRSKGKTVTLGTDEESYARLKNEVVYLRAEVEFLKKISQQAISGKRGK